MLTHLNKNNNPQIVDISEKSKTLRIAIASGNIQMSETAFNAIISNEVKKGPVLQTAIIAGIQGAKKTSELIPMCHQIMISHINIETAFDEQNLTIALIATVKTTGETGVEMEALTAVSIGLLTIYDMVKAIDKEMTINNIALSSKTGGKSGEYRRK